jgi:hypothetical protein
MTFSSRAQEYIYLLANTVLTYEITESPWSQRMLCR